VKKVTKTVATFSLPGVFFPETVSQEVESRDISKLDPPPGAYAVQFYDVSTVTAEDGEVYGGQAKDRSPRYLVGKQYTVREIQLMFPEETVLATNVRNNATDGYGILCPAGNWQCVGPGDEWYGETW
jgi:hypothetical protein